MPTEEGPRAAADSAEQPEELEAGLDAAGDGDAAVSDLRNRLLRMAADFDNYRKRSRQEMQESARYASQGLVVQLLPVLDDLHRSLDHAPEGVDDGWLKGLSLSVQKLEEVLRDQGLQRVDALGTPFDPALHEAIGTESSDEHPDDTVIDELRAGYRLHDRVVRPALVRVSRRG